MNNSKSNLSNSFFLVLAFVAASTLGIKGATSVSVVNASFESPVLSPSPGYTNDSVSGWTIDGSANFGAGIQLFTTASFDSADPLPAPADGNQALYIAHGDTVYQDVGALLADTTYDLTLAVGQRLESANQGGGIFELVNGSTDAGTVLVASTLDTPTAGTFNLQSISFTTGNAVSGDLSIVLKQTSGNQVIFDNVQLTDQAVPEPTTMAFFIFGLLGAITLFLFRRRNLFA